jgi:hypothetical protein
MPYAGDPTDYPETVLIDGTDLQDLTGVWFSGVNALAGLFAPLTRRGGTKAIPGATGTVRSPGKSLDEFAFSIPVLVEPLDDDAVDVAGIRQRRAQTWDNYTALIAACAGTDGLVVITRRRPTAAGHADHHADGEFINATGVQWEDRESLSAQLNFLVTAGQWLDGSDAAVLP